MEQAAGLALAEPVSLPRYRMRRHLGMTDEVIAPLNAYSASIVVVEPEPIEPRGETALPLVVLTEASMPAKAVEVAVALRTSGRASLFGEDVAVAAAEARWAGVGAGGLSVRWRELVDERGVLLGDTLAADRRAEDPACLVTSPADVPSAPGAPEFGEATRPVLVFQDSFGLAPPEDATPAHARAALVSTHASLWLFSPFASPKLDERLAETLGAVGAGPVLPRPEVRKLLRRFGTAIDDGHQVVFGGTAPSAGSFLVALERLANGEPMVRRSATEGINPGDVLVSVGGRPMSDWLAENLAITSAATEGHRFELAVRDLLALPGPAEFGVRSPDGAERLVTVEPRDFEALEAFQFRAKVVRPAGPLDDSGAPDLYYINLDTNTLASNEDINLALAAAAGAKGLVLDMRGRPTFDPDEVAQRVIREPFLSPRFRIPVLNGPDRRELADEVYELEPLDGPSFDGPVVLLVGHGTVSAGETFASMLVGAGRVTVVGRQSAATNGNITGVALPAGFGFLFTGMNVGFPDGRPYNGVGIAPDVPVTFEPATFAAGRDPELDAAVARLNAPGLAPSGRPAEAPADVRPSGTTSNDVVPLGRTFAQTSAGQNRGGRPGPRAARRAPPLALTKR